ncbi:C4-dicarboxylate ABC transporter [Bacillus methanolicus]|nr:DctP family TRAP transporter solute-binding subunit [Bacillus methanolicus]MDE3837859.1 C4-dicarboxylate ABC transporter [Bacillus methanolicus]
MRWFIITSCITVFILMIFLVYENERFGSKIPEDDEQKGLKEQIVIRLSHVVSENTPKGLAAQKFAELVQKKTNGKVKVEVYANGFLYPDGEELDALERGEIQMAAPSFTKMTNIVPEWKVLDLPFLFRDDKHVKFVFTGEIGREMLNMLDEKSMKALAFWSNGFKQMTSRKKPLLKVSDFKGQTFRVMSGEVLERQFQMLGAEAVATPFNEVYSTLENQKVDGQENTISNIYSKSLYKHQKNLTLSNHGYLGYAVIINEDFWNELSPSIQDKIKEALDETTVWILNESSQMNKKQLKELKNKSDLKIYDLPPEAKERWIEKFKPLYEEVEQEVGSDMIEKIKEAGD